MHTKEVPSEKWRDQHVHHRVDWLRPLKSLCSHMAALWLPKLNFATIPCQWSIEVPAYILTWSLGTYVIAALHASVSSDAGGILVTP